MSNYKKHMYYCRPPSNKKNKINIPLVDQFKLVRWEKQTNIVILTMKCNRKFSRSDCNSVKVWISDSQDAN